MAVHAHLPFVTLPNSSRRRVDLNLFIRIPAFRLNSKQWTGLTTPYHHAAPEGVQPKAFETLARLSRSLLGQESFLGEEMGTSAPDGRVEMTAA